MKRPELLAVLALAISVTASIAWAGTTYLLTCGNEKCGFKGEVKFGGGRIFEMVTGYCLKCEKFVYLRWTREGKGVKNQTPKPQAVGRIWDATTGRTIDLYACPHCTSAFLPIASEEDLRCCPKCGQPTLKQEECEIYD
jgi:hypothetical protein